MKRRLKALPRLKSLTLVIALVLSACGGDTQDSGTTTTADTSAETTTTAETTTPEETAPPNEAAVELGFDDGPQWSFLDDHSGVTLNVMIHPSFYNGIGGDDGLVQEFERISGASVNIITAPAGESYQRQMLEWASESPTFDVVFPVGWDPHEGFRRHLLALDDYMADAPPEWEPGNFIQGVAQFFVTDGVTWGLPFRWGPDIYVYRADLFEEAGVEVPRSFEEIDEVARRVHAETGKFGWVLRGTGHELPQDYLSLVATAGGDLFDSNTTCVVNSAEGVEVLTTIIEWIDDGILPTDTLAVSRDDSVTLITQDRAAQAIYFAGRWPLLVGDDALPVVQENLSYPDAFPGPFTRITPGPVAIPKYSENPDTAWAFVEYILHPRNTPRHVLEWSGVIQRVTDVELPEMQDRFPITKHIVDISDGAVAVRPLEASHQIFDILNEELTAAILGQKSPADALDSACARIDPLT